MIPLSASGQTAGSWCRGTISFVTFAKNTCTTHVSDCTNPPPLGKNPYSSVSWLLCCTPAHCLISDLFFALHRLARLLWPDLLGYYFRFSLAFLHACTMMLCIVMFQIRVHLSWFTFIVYVHCFVSFDYMHVLDDFSPRWQRQSYIPLLLLC